MRARSPRLTPGRPAGRLAAVLFALLLVLGLGVVPATSLAASGDAAGPPSQGGSGDGSAAGAGATHRVTLLTGDVVVLHTAPGGHQTAWIAKPATPPDRGVPPEIYQLDGQVHVIPAEAAPYVTSGALDANLFNVSLLVQQGYSDEARHDLPLLVQAKGGPSATHTPAVPSGARKIRELDSIATVSVDAPKRQIRSVWESLRGQHAAAYDADDAHLAAAGKVWLNGMAHATLEDSVPQIGAPEAWAAASTEKGSTSRCWTPATTRRTPIWQGRSPANGTSPPRRTRRARRPWTGTGTGPMWPPRSPAPVPRRTAAAREWPQERTSG
jgi:hypothetical protein